MGTITTATAVLPRCPGAVGGQSEAAGLQVARLQGLRDLEDYNGCPGTPGRETRDQPRRAWLSYRKSFWRWLRPTVTRRPAGGAQLQGLGVAWAFGAQGAVWRAAR